jgi:hypothetical protein
MNATTEKMAEPNTHHKFACPTLCTMFVILTPRNASNSSPTAIASRKKDLRIETFALMARVYVSFDQ